MSEIEPLDDFRTPKQLYGLEEHQYLLIMHLSQFAGYLVPLAGFVAPVVLWVVNKDKNEAVDRHGRTILNWIISSLIYGGIGFVLMFVLIGIPMLWALALLAIIFPIIGGLKANQGEYWKYPLSIPFF